MRKSLDEALIKFSSLFSSVQKVTTNQLQKQLIKAVISFPAKMTTHDIEIQEKNLRASDNDLQAEEHLSAEAKITEPRLASKKSTTALPYQYVPLRMGGNGGTHKPH